VPSTLTVKISVVDEDDNTNVYGVRVCEPIKIEYAEEMFTAIARKLRSIKYMEDELSGFDTSATQELLEEETEEESEETEAE
jgi:hypothetical protein